MSCSIEAHIQLTFQDSKGHLIAFKTEAMLPPLRGYSAKLFSLLLMVITTLNSQLYNVMIESSTCNGSQKSNFMIYTILTDLLLCTFIFDKQILFQTNLSALIYESM